MGFPPPSWYRAYGDNYGTDDPYVTYFKKKLKRSMYPSKTIYPPDKFTSYDGWVHVTEEQRDEYNEWIKNELIEFEDELSFDAEIRIDESVRWG